MLALAAPSPITGAISPTKAHLYKPRGAQEHSGRQEPKSRTLRRAPSRIVLGVHHPHGLVEKPIKMSQCWSTF